MNKETTQKTYMLSSQQKANRFQKSGLGSDSKAHKPVSYDEYTPQIKCIWDP